MRRGLRLSTRQQFDFQSTLKAQK